MLFGSGLLLVLLLAWSALMWLFVVVSLANVSKAFASGVSTGGNCTMLTVMSLQITILWLSLILGIYPIPLMCIWMTV